MVRFFFLIFFLFFSSSAFSLERGVLPSPSEVNKEAGKKNEEAISHFREGHWKTAEKYFREAITISPEFAEAYFNLGLTLNNAGKSEEARAAFKKAMELAPKNKNINETGKRLIFKNILK